MIFRIKRTVLILCLCPFALVWASQPKYVGLTEVWAYLMDGEERFYTPDLPVTDIGYFGAGIGRYGNLVGVPDRDKLANSPARIHLVVAEVSGNYGLSHFILNPDYGVRDRFIEEILYAMNDFDGLQIDFESVTSRDSENFLNFLEILKDGIGNKTLSVAVPARTKRLKNDAYDYKELSRIADRIIIMAYDEHWSGSRPGPVASFPWSKSVALYALRYISSSKLIMGLPFYGRAWADRSTSRALKYSTLQELIAEKEIPPEAFEESQGVGHFDYQETVNISVYFDNAITTLNRLSLYQSLGVKNAAFWRLGQEDDRVWEYILLENKDNPRE